MHFNDAIMNFRLKALDGVALAISVPTGVFVGKAQPFTVAKEGLFAVGIGFLFLSLGWIAIFCLDSLYYGKLLRGAVSEIIRLEKSPGFHTELSTRIERFYEAKARSGMCNIFSNHFVSFNSTFR